MRTLCCLIVLGLSVGAGQTQACDLSKFGQHAPPPTPIHAPPVDDQYGHFEWGTDAFRDQYQNWWGWNFVQNDTKGQPLTLDWKKGGILNPVARPLPSGEVSCRTHLLADDPKQMPILDKDAPILYSVNNQHQDAAVYVTPSAAATPGSPVKAATSEDIFETAYKDDKETVQRVLVNVRTYGDPGKYAFSFLKQPEDIIIGISKIADTLSQDYFVSFARDFEKQGITLNAQHL
jgi:hypothetical protein